jgi:F-type H+-transporting ATPase subunit epsilon
MPLTVEIVTAEKVVYSQEGVDEVVAPGVDGEFAVLPEHAAFITTLAPGEMRILKGGDEEAMAITGGFFEVRNDRVVILSGLRRSTSPAPRRRARKRSRRCWSARRWSTSSRSRPRCAAPSLACGSLRSADAAAAPPRPAPAARASRERASDLAPRSSFLVPRSPFLALTLDPLPLTLLR